MESTTLIAVGRGAVVLGDIISRDAAIAGKIRGRLIVASRLEIEPSSDVEGEIDTPRLSIKDGARVNAIIKMSRRRGQPSQGQTHRRPPDRMADARAPAYR